MNTIKTEAWTGRTVKVREYNGYDDSDFYATYWDGEKFVEELCGTTRFAFPCSATVDATPEIMLLWKKECEKQAAIEREEMLKKMAADPTVGKRVSVVSGKKYKGLEGVVFWRGANQYRTYYRNGYNRPEDLHNQVLGIKKDDGTKFFIPATYVEVIQPNNQ